MAEHFCVIRVQDEGGYWKASVEKNGQTIQVEYPENAEWTDICCSISNIILNLFD